MNFSAIVLKNFKHNFKKYLSFFFVSSFIVSVLYMYGSLVFNEGMKELFGASMNTMLVATFLGIILFATVFILYTSYSFIKYRGKELGVYFTLGMTTKDVKKIILNENIFISIGSILTGITFGLVFSKLFYLLLGNIIKMENLPFEISIESMAVTTIIFLLIFIASIICVNIYISRVNVLDLIKSQSKADNHKDRPLLTVVLVIVTTILLLITPKILNGVLFNDPALFGQILVGFGIGLGLISPFIVIGNLISLIKFLLKKNRKVYNNNILLLSNLTHKFSGYKVILYVTTLLVIGSIFFIGFGYSQYASVKRSIDSSNPYDLTFVSTKDYNNISKDDMIAKLKENDISVKEYKELEFLAIQRYQEVDGNKVISYDSNMPVISESIFNEYSEKNVDAKPGEVIEIQSSRHGYVEESGDKNWGKGTHYFTVETLFEANKTTQNEQLFNENEEGYLEADLDMFLNAVPEEKIIKFESNEEEVITYLTVNEFNSRYQDSYSMIVVDDKDYQDIKNKSDINSIRSFNSISYKGNIEDGDTAVFDILRRVNNDSTLWTTSTENGNWFPLENNRKDILEEMKPDSKKMEFDTSIALNGFNFFSMFFLGMIFLTSTGVVLLYKVMTSVDEEQDRVKSLRRVGVCRNEVEKSLLKELKLIFFVPVVFGSILGFTFLWIMLTNVGDKAFLYTQIAYVIAGYAVCQGIFYYITKGKYLREVLRQYK